MNTKRTLSFAASLMLIPSGSLLAQSSGTANPEPIDYTAATNSDAGSAPAPVASCAAPAQPAAATPALQPRTPEIVYGAYKPYVPPAHKDAQMSQVRQNGPSPVIDGGDGGIVTTAPATINALPAGTQVEAFLQAPISTQSTPAGSHFVAVLNADIVQNGVVVLPAGSLIKGRLTHVKPGNHGVGPAAIHLQPDSINTLDGTGYALKAEVTGLDHFKASRVNSEGTIVSNGNGKNAALAFGVTTGTAIVSGAIIGGGVGAAVGLGVGAGIATVWYFKHDHQQTLPAGTEIVFTLQDNLQLNPATH
jgi:hypothetical protein